MSKLIPVPKWNNYHDWPTVGSLRNMIFFEHQNGLAKAVKRIGRRVLIDEEAFFQWIEEQNPISQRGAK